MGWWRSVREPQKSTTINYYAWWFWHNLYRWYINFCLFLQHIFRLLILCLLDNWIWQSEQVTATIAKLLQYSHSLNWPVVLWPWRKSSWYVNLLLPNFNGFFHDWYSFYLFCYCVIESMWQLLSNYNNFLLPLSSTFFQHSLIWWVSHPSSHYVDHTISMIIWGQRIIKHISLCWSPCLSHLSAEMRVLVSSLWVVWVNDDLPDSLIMDTSSTKCP